MPEMTWSTGKKYFPESTELKFTKKIISVQGGTLWYFYVCILQIFFFKTKMEF